MVGYNKLTATFAAQRTYPSLPQLLLVPTSNALFGYTSLHQQANLNKSPYLLVVLYAMCIGKQPALTFPGHDEPRRAGAELMLPLPWETKVGGVVYTGYLYHCTHRIVLHGKSRTVTAELWIRVLCVGPYFGCAGSNAFR